MSEFTGSKGASRGDVGANTPAMGHFCKQGDQLAGHDYNLSARRMWLRHREALSTIQTLYLLKLHAFALNVEAPGIEDSSMTKWKRLLITKFSPLL